MPRRVVHRFVGLLCVAVWESDTVYITILSIPSSSSSSFYFPSIFPLWIAHSTWHEMTSPLRRSMEMLDPEQNVWVAKAPMTRVRSGVAAVAHGSCIYAVGGFDGTSVFQTVEKYDTTTDEWSDGPFMCTKRFALALALVGDKIYAMGGGDGIDVLKKVKPASLCKQNEHT